MKQFFSLFFVAFCLLCFLPSFALSQASGSTSTICKISVRLICARTAEENGLKFEEGAAMSSFTEDMKAQLASLPFDSYEPLDMQSKEVSFGQEAMFRLGKKLGSFYDISLTPHMMEGEVVSLSIDWRDEMMHDILKTKLMLPMGKNLVVGTEKTPEYPVLAGIKLECK